MHLSTMEKSRGKQLRGEATLNPFESIENHTKKRPSTTKLDLQKMYGESLQLSSQYKKLLKEHESLKQQFNRVEAVKSSRQNLISVVERMVEEKSMELGQKGSNFSWLVFKLNHKIYDLKGKIESKNKAIEQMMVSRESEGMRQREAEIRCLEEIVEFARGEGLGGRGEEWKAMEGVDQIREMIWMEQELKQKEAEIVEAEKNYSSQEKHVRAMMLELAQKKAELKAIKEREEEYQRAQEVYKEEKKKKEQRIAGSKNYLEELQIKRGEEIRRLEELKTRHAKMQEEETREIQALRDELQKLKEQHSERSRTRQETKVKQTVAVTPVSKKREVKRVTYQQVKRIGESIRYLMALKGLSEQYLGELFNAELNSKLSIKQVVEILTSEPICMEKEADALLVARYVVEDSGDGLFLEDMDTSQSTSIIKSILGRLVGRVEVYSWEEGEELRQKVGQVMHRFGKLVIQFFQNKEGSERMQRRISVGGERFLVRKEQLEEAIELNLSSVQSQSQLQEQISFTLFYLFSWSHNLQQLDIYRLFSMQQTPINWPK